MPASLALGFCALLIFWLFNRDRDGRKNTSYALWIPLTWAFIIGSRPASLWLGITRIAESEGGLQDKLVDKALFLCLITAGLIILHSRRVDWSGILRRNRWLFAYFAYLGLSVCWSDDSFTSLKRWIKDFGNVVMVLVVLSEDHPEEAIRVFLARCAFLLIPISTLILKYYSHLGRNYDSWTNQPVFVGVSTDKNTFGMALFVSALSLLWILLGLRDQRSHGRTRTELCAYSALMLMTVWLLGKAHSATALSCTLFGGCLLFALRFPAITRQVRRLGSYVAGMAALVLILQVTGAWGFAVAEFSQALGRDAKLHGREDIWRKVLQEDINPLAGVGFYSFWSEERNQRISEGFYYNLGTAHNGYLETYLNTGLIGLSLLALAIVSGVKGIQKDVLAGSRFGALRLSFLFTIVIYNITESAFDRLVPVWFTLLLVIVDCPRAITCVNAEIDEAAGNSQLGPSRLEPMPLLQRKAHSW
jgi:exopolysaccharide production protein ExoQ